MTHAGVAQPEPAPRSVDSGWSPDAGAIPPPVWERIRCVECGHPVRGFLYGVPYCYRCAEPTIRKAHGEATAEKNRRT